MYNQLFIHFYYAASFALAVAAIAWILQHLRSKGTWWIVALVVLYILASVWLGLIKGWAAWVVGLCVAWLLSSDRFLNWRDCRRYGKQVATELGVNPNLFFSALEVAMDVTAQKGTSVMLLAHMSRSKVLKDEAYKTLLPGLVIGFEVLEKRFGAQRNIAEARVKITPLVKEYCGVDVLQPET